jgi:hypothetical protein
VGIYVGQNRARKCVDKEVRAWFVLGFLQIGLNLHQELGQIELAKEYGENVSTKIADHGCHVPTPTNNKSFQRLKPLVMCSLRI